jgi:hypothetical protein
MPDGSSGTSLAPTSPIGATEPSRPVASALAAQRRWCRPRTPRGRDRQRQRYGLDVTLTRSTLGPWPRSPSPATPTPRRSPSSRDSVRTAAAVSERDLHSSERAGCHRSLPPRVLGGANKRGWPIQSCGQGLNRLSAVDQRTSDRSGITASSLATGGGGRLGPVAQG